MQPIAEVEEAVVHRQQDHRDHAGHRDRPVGMRLVLDVDDLLPLPLAGVVLPPVDDVGGERGAAEAVRACRIVVEAHFERNQPVLAEIERLLRRALLEIPQMDAAPILQMADLLEVEAGHEGVGGGPFRGSHHIVARLVPEIVAERDVAHRGLPAPDDVEVPIKVQIAARGLALGVAEHRYDDLGAEAVDGVRRAEDWSSP